MKNYFTKLFIIGAIFITFFATSCANFMNGADAKKELQEKIEYSSETNHLKVLSISPSYNLSGSYYDSPIIINFNQPVNKATFSYTVKISDTDITYLYNDPEFYENDTIVRLNVNRENLKSFSVAKGDIKDVLFTISSSVKSAAGSTIDKDNLSYKFRFNSNTDNTPPEIIELYFAKTKEEAENAKNGNKANHLTLKGFDNWDEDDIYGNHVRTIWVYCKAVDNESGVYGFSGTETLLEDTKGVSVGTSENYSSNNDNCFTQVSEKTGVYESIFEYNFTTVKDGVVQIELSIIDVNGNISNEKKTITLIKDTTLEQVPYITNIKMDNSWFCRDINEDGMIKEPDESVSSVEAFNNYAGNFCISNIEKKYFYKNYVNNLTLTLCTGKNSNSLVEKKRISIGETNSLSLKLSKEEIGNIDEDCYLKFSIFDEVGNCVETEALLPSTPAVTRYSGVYVYKRSTVTYTNGYVYFTNYSSFPGVESFAIKYDPENNSIRKLYIGNTRTSTNGSLNFEANSNMFDQGISVISFYQSNNVLLCGFINPTTIAIIKNDIQNVNDELPEISNLNLSYNENNHSMNATINLTNLETVNNYEKVFIEYYDENSKTNAIILDGANTSYTLTFSKPVYLSLNIYGISTGKQRVVSYQLSQEESDFLDNICSIDLTGPELWGLCYGYPDPVSNTIKLESIVNESEYLLNSNNKIEYTFYWTPYKSTWNINTEDRPIDEIKTFNNFIIEADIDEDFEFSIDFLKDGSYLLYYSASDIHNNITYKKIGKLVRTTVPMPTMTYLGSGKMQFDFDTNNTNTSNYDNTCMLSYVSNDNKWIDEFDYMRNFDSTNSGLCRKTVTVENAIGKYVRFFVKYKSRDINDTQCNLPVPLYAYVPDGTKYTDSNVTYRNVFTGLNGYTVLSDRPCVAQIIYNKENLGDNPDMWEKYTISTQKINPKIIDGNGEYKPDIKKVPYDFYYITIFHFADGTSIITPVNQKTK